MAAVRAAPGHPGHRVGQDITVNPELHLIIPSSRTHPHTRKPYSNSTLSARDRQNRYAAGEKGGGEGAGSVSRGRR
ncbi:hypothetical protein GCM10018952_49280 [Streptosporangium vulgare]